MDSIKSALPRSTVYNLRSRMTRLRSGMKKINHAQLNNHASKYLNNKGSPKITKKRKRKRSTASSDGSVKCAICLDTQKTREMQYIVCGHGFHFKCLTRWLMLNNFCPICRTQALQTSMMHNRIEDPRDRAYFHSVLSRRGRRRRRGGINRERFSEYLFNSAGIIIIDILRWRNFPDGTWEPAPAQLEE